MKSLLPILTAVALSAACTSGTKVVPGSSGDRGDRVTALEKRIDDIDGRLQKIEGLLRQAFEGSEEPDSTTVYSVPVAGFPYIGAKDAKVTIVKAYEFACGYCYRVRDTINELMKAYPGEIKVVYKSFIVHADVAVAPAMAACAADKQGKFMEMSDLIWEKAFLERDLSEEKITELAGGLGMDMARYTSDAKGEACLNSLRESVENLSALGVSGTPTFYINGRMLVGAQPLPQFRQLIDEELAKANQLIAQGTPLADLYQRHVVEAGKTTR